MNQNHQPMQDNMHSRPYGAHTQFPHFPLTLTSDEHIGRWFKREIFEPHELKAKDVAKKTGISESKLSKFLNQKIDLDHDLAIRLAHNFELNAENLVTTYAAYKFRVFYGELQRDLNIFHSASHYTKPITPSVDNETESLKTSSDED
jgi:plasmid maintenance system antidote protein VapI